MQSLPHHYKASARGHPQGPIRTTSPELDPLQIDAPAEFGGSGDEWSPETLLAGSVATCFILTFRALSRHAGMDWHELTVEADGTLDKKSEGLRFTHFHLIVRLSLESESEESTVRVLLEKAEKHCLISNSLVAESALEIDLRT